MSISDTSARQYATTYMYLIRKAGSESLGEIFRFIKDADVKDATKMSYLNSIISLKKYDPSLVTGNLSEIVEYRDKLQVQIERARGERNSNESQTEAMEMVNLRTLQEFVDKLGESKYESIKGMEDYLLVKMMTRYPLRNDLQDIRLTTRKSDLNSDYNSLYVPPDGKGECVLSLPHYKTSKRYGRVMVRLDPEFTDDVLVLISDGRKYLFPNNKGEPMSSSNFTHKLNRIFEREFGVRISSTLIRKIYLTGKYGQTLQQMREDSRVMGHNLDTQQRSYISNDSRLLDLQ